MTVAEKSKRELMEKQWDKKIIRCKENYRACGLRMREGTYKGAECIAYGDAIHGCQHGRADG